MHSRFRQFACSVGFSALVFAAPASMGQQQSFDSPGQYAPGDPAAQQAERQATQPLNNAPVWREVRSGVPAITAVRGRNYTAEPSYGLYPTSGASDDYVYARHWENPAKGKTYGFVIEWGTRFHPQWSEMELIIDDISAALVDFCHAILNSNEFIYVD